MANARQFMAARTAAWAKSCGSLPYNRELDFVINVYGNGPRDAWWSVLDLNYADDVGFEVELIRLINNTSDIVAIGTRASSLQNASRCFVGCYNNLTYFGWNDLITTTAVPVGIKYVQGLNFLNSRKATLNGSVIKSGLNTLFPFPNFKVAFPLYAGDQNIHEIFNSGDRKYYAYGEAKFSVGSEIVKDIIPVELIDGTITYYDKVSNNVLLRDGNSTGEFKEYLTDNLMLSS